MRCVRCGLLDRPPQLPNPSVINTALVANEMTPPLLSVFYGDVISLSKDVTHIRSYGINVCGILPTDQYTEGSFVEALKLLQVDFWGLQVVNLNIGCPRVAYNINSLLKKNGTRTQVQLSTLPEIHPTRYKYGGT